MLIVILIALFLVLALLDYRATLYDDVLDKKIKYKNAPWQWKFFEVWASFANFCIAGLIGYYFVYVRLEPISKGGSISTADFVLFFIFAMCLFRWFPYLLKNLTEGINSILKRVLEK